MPGIGDPDAAAGDGLSAGGRRVWTDLAPFIRRRETAAAALLAVARSLEKHRPLGGAEDAFLARFRALAAAPPEVFGAVWTDPTAYAWVRIAFERVAACLRPARDGGSPDPEAARALRAHLAQFARFTLAHAALTGGDCDLAEPLEVALPFALPTSRLVLEGTGRAAIAGARAGKPFLAAQPTATSSAAWVESPAVRLAGGAEVRLQPTVMSAFGILEPLPPAEAGLAYQRSQAAFLESVLAIVRRHAPDTYAQLETVARVIALKPIRTGSFTNATFSELPGAMILSLVPETWEMADSLVHEAHHDRLYALEEQDGAYFADPAKAISDARFPSPWRRDPRPLHGVLHGAYVYLAVTRFWAQALGSGELDEFIASHARTQIAQQTAAIAGALETLERNAELTPAGRALLDALAAESASLRAEMARLGIEPRAAAAVAAMAAVPPA